MEDKAVQNIEIEKLQCEPQVRKEFDEESLVGLAQTIKETGILQPLLVRRDGSRFVIIEGHRRLLAAKMAGLTEVPVLIDDRELTEAEVVYRQLVVNCSREDLQPLEKARSIRRLMNAANWSAAHVALKLGMSSGMVSKLLALLDLPKSVQEKVADGSLAPTTAYVLSRGTDAEGQCQLANQAANGGLTRQAVAERIKSRKAARRSSTEPRRNGSRHDRVNIALGSGRSVMVAGPKLTLSSMIDWLGELLDRLRSLPEQNLNISDAIKVISKQSETAGR